MSDLLLDLSTNPNSRRLLKQLGLPIPMPQALRRGRGPWNERPLADRHVVFSHDTAERGLPVEPERASLERAVALTVVRAGAKPVVVSGNETLSPAWVEAGEAFGRPPTLVDAGPAIDGLRAHGLIFDATGISGPEDLRTLYDFFHTWIRNVDRSGRVVILGRPPEDVVDSGQNAARGALVGFIKSIAKEVGRLGATAHLVYIQHGAEKHLEPTLRWLLSDRSAFVDGQVFRLSKRLTASGGVRWTRPLEGKRALVTGAARGIGAATAGTLAAAGAKVTILDLPSDNAKAAAVAQSVSGDMLLVDITSPDAGTMIVEHFRALGGLDIVVHNAGITRDKTIAKMKVEHWDLCVAVNLTAVASLTRQLLDTNVMRSDGRIVCLSSIAGIAGNMGQTNYAASKAGIIAYVEALSKDPVVLKRDITVNAIAPGFIETRLTDRMPVAIREVARRFNALSQGGKPVDVAELVTFLASPGAQGLTANTIRVCGLNMVGA